MSPARTYVGIDVAKANLDVASEPPGLTTTVPNTEVGLQALVPQLQARAPERIVVEATGGYELPVVRALVEAALPVIVVNPRAITCKGACIFFDKLFIFRTLPPNFSLFGKSSRPYKGGEPGRNARLFPPLCKGRSGGVEPHERRALCLAGALIHTDSLDSRLPLHCSNNAATGTSIAEPSLT